MKMNTKIHIDTWTITRFWLILFAIILSTAAIYWARKGLFLIGMSLFLAIALNPLVSFFQRKLFKGNRILAAILAFVLCLVVIVLFGLMLGPLIGGQLMSFISGVPDMLVDIIDSLKQLEAKDSRLNIQPIIAELSATVETNRQEWISQAGSKIFSGVNSVITSISASLLVLTLTFMILLELPKISKYIWGLYRNQATKRQHQRVVGKMYKAITGFVNGQLSLATLNAVLTSLVVFILTLIFDLPSNLIAPVGITVGLIGLIPMVGATIGSVIGALVVAFFSWQAAIVFLIYCVIYQQIENSIISPVVQSKSVELSGLIVLVAVTLGMYVFGLIGGLISIPIAGCLKILIEEAMNVYGIESLPEGGISPKTQLASKRRTKKTKA